MNEGGPHWKMWASLRVGGRSLFLYLGCLSGVPARRAGSLRRRRFKIKKQGLSFERWFLCPAGTAAFLFVLFGPPARRAADGGLLGAAAPPRPPLHSPRTTPLGLVVYPHSHGLALKGFPVSDTWRGLRGFCSGSFLATLGDLPARHAMPACDLALSEERR